MLLFFFSIFYALTTEAMPPSIVGHWFYYKKIYQGQEYPERPSSTLRLHFEFNEDGESHLYWWHEGLGDHCSRKGRFYIENDHIVDEVVWVDPNNTADCAYDPDMQKGRKTKTPYYFILDDLVVRFHIGGEPLDYVWKRIN
ncbi:MAG: hypothetical protein M9962_09690 [Oligoflexia bacterium]|nr:hypothetical protein [Oligoflexia bacterium]